jgi:hypothetical protein
MKKIKKLVKGDIFIIPNIAKRFISFIDSNWMKERSRRLIGVEPVDDDMMVAVWITSSMVDNWQDNFAGFQTMVGLLETDDDEIKWEENSPDARLLGYFPKYIPANILAGKKEGDEITFHCDEYDVDIVLTCKQRGYRYASFGNFEDVLRYVLREG